MVPWYLPSLHTKPSPDEYGLERNEERAAGMEGEEILTRHTTIGRFLLLTKESMSMMPEYPGVLY